MHHVNSSLLSSHNQCSTAVDSAESCLTLWRWKDEYPAVAALQRPQMRIATDSAPEETWARP